ncbi:flavodoxin [compost metagenome]
MITLVAVAVAIGLSAFTTMAVKDRTYVSSPAYSPVGESAREAAVIYYSRSGHTEAVAREVARKLNAPIARIDADYALGFKGQSKAMTDATSGAFPPIRIEPIDLRQARRVYLVSPTWMFRPAPPLWSYVDQTDLSGKEIVLIMTGNSRFKQDEIDAFSSLVDARGGRLIHHTFLRRGRIYWQQSRSQLLEEIDARMDALIQ